MFPTKIGEVVGSSELDKMGTMLDHNSRTIHDLTKSKPGMWRFPTDSKVCCIYRVPSCLREVNPEAYTPQLVLIGPLHHSLKSQALTSCGDITNTKLMGYLNMEEHKRNYLEAFAKRLDRKKTVDEFRRIIQEEEDMIRASYSESTVWIPSLDFVEMILRDSVFILELILRTYEKDSSYRSDRTGDPLIDVPCLQTTIKRDLIMLENQLPYFILEKLFDPVIPRLNFHDIRVDRRLKHPSLRRLIIRYFKFDDVQDTSKFVHLTDFARFNRVTEVTSDPFFADVGHRRERRYYLYNADMLHRGGVKFKALPKKLSVEVWFGNGCLEIPRFMADEEEEITLRNIMALEQCHYPLSPKVCDYIIFLDLLINTEKDVDLLVDSGIIINLIGDHRAVAEMVNNLGLGILDDGWSYRRIVDDVLAYYSNPINRSLAILKRVYLGNLWTGTATVAATFLLIMTLIQTVASIIQVMQNA